MCVCACVCVRNTEEKERERDTGSTLGTIIVKEVSILAHPLCN